MKSRIWIWIAACLPLWAQAAIPYVYPFNAMSGQEVIEHRLKEPKTQLDYINREKTAERKRGAAGPGRIAPALSLPWAGQEEALSAPLHTRIRSRRSSTATGGARPYC